MTVLCQLILACAMLVDWFMRKSIKQCYVSPNIIHLRTQQEKKGYILIYSTVQRKKHFPSEIHHLWPNNAGLIVGLS